MVDTIKKMLESYPFDAAIIVSIHGYIVFVTDMSISQFRGRPILLCTKDDVRLSLNIEAITSIRFFPDFDLGIV
jgi:hypothetical protein